MKIINSTPNPLFLAYIILLFGLFTRVFKFLQNVSILAGQDKIFTVESKVGLSKFGLDAEVNSQRKNFRQKSAKDESANFEFFDHIF